MLGIVLLLALFSVMLLLFEKKIYDALGMVPTPKRLLIFTVGSIMAGMLVLVNIALETIVCSVRWEFASAAYRGAALVAWKFLLAVLTEELAFRGIVLYVLLRKATEQAAMVISAALFGLYHWFSYGMFGAGIVPMLYVFLITALAGYSWAYAFIKSKTLLLPLGLHFGWNCIGWLFADGGSYGQGLFRRASAVPLTGLQEFYLSLFTGLAPGVLTYIMLYLYYVKRNKRNPRREKL